jgi:hypothetical protein
MKRSSRNSVVAAVWTALIAMALSAPVCAVSVYVKYRGPVDLAPFQCEAVTRSSLITQLCYDPKERYVIVALSDTYYHYCDVPPDIVSSWRSAQSMGRFFNASIKGRYDCRTGHVPGYDRKG